MTDAIRLSLIVPVYNVAPFLPRCLDSLLAQDLNGIEIIVVDDGATDECPSILADYQASYPGLLTVIRQENAGLSEARNTGLDHAKGTYVAFVDSDDWIDPTYYRRLLDLAVEHDLEMAHGNAVFHFEGRREDQLIYQDDLSADVMSGRAVLHKRLAEKTFLHMVWMHLYRRDFIEANRMRFIRGRIHEDVLWTTQAFLLAKRVAYDPTPGYFYRQRIRRYTQAQTDARFEVIIDSSIRNALGLAEMADALGDDPVLAGLIRWQLVDGGLSVFHKLRKIADSATRCRVRQQCRELKLYGTLWRSATLFSQRRRIARNWLQGLFKA